MNISLKKNHYISLCFIFYQICLIFFINNKTYPVYGTNDDVIIKSFISGDFTGKPEFFLKASATPRLPFSLLISNLYKLSPNFEWYSIALLITVLLSWTLLLIALNNLTKSIYTLFFNLMFLIFHFVFFTYYVITPTYTFAAILPSVSGFIYILIAIIKKNLNSKIFFFMALWSFWGFSIRSESFLLSFISIFFIVILILQNIRKALFPVSIFLSSLFILIIVNNLVEYKIIEDNLNWSSYINFENNRYKIQDNLLESKLSSNPNQFGWSKAEYEVFDSYLFADETVFDNIKLNQVIKPLGNQFLNLDIDFVLTSINNFKNTLFPWTDIIVGIFIMFLFFVVANISDIFKKILLSLFSIAPLLFCTFFIATFLRFPERIVVSLILLLFLVLIFICVILSTNDNLEEKNFKLKFGLISIISFLIVSDNLNGTIKWIYSRYETNSYRQFWDFQKNKLDLIEEPYIVVGNSSQFKSDWAFPYSRQNTEIYRYLSLGWHTFSPHWVVRKDQLGFSNVNLLSESTKNAKILWMGNADLPLIMNNYISEKNYGNFSLKVIDFYSVGEFKFYLYSFSSL